MRDTKYITFEHWDLGPIMIVFPAILTHVEMSKRLGTGFKPVSAGFVYIKDGVAICHDESVSLDLKSNPDIDNKLAKRLFFGNGF